MSDRRTPNVFVIAFDADAPVAHNNPFAGTTRVTLRPCGAPSSASTSRHRFDVFAVSASRIHAASDPSNRYAVYLWGDAVNEAGLRGRRLLEWCAANAFDDPKALRELLGHFVLIIDDRKTGRMSFVSDVLGVRPWFVGSHDGRLVAGSDALAIAQAGLTSGEVNYDAIAAWLTYNQDFAGEPVVAGFRPLAPGAITTFDGTGKLISEVAYGALTYADEPVETPRMIQRLHEIVSGTFDRLVGERDEVALPLSGGFDSRYLLALARRRARPWVHAETIQTGAFETGPARAVAAALDQPLRIIPLDRPPIDLFDDPFAFNGAGFPQGRNLTNHVARRHPGMSLLSGYLGDGLMRGSMTAAGNAYFDQELEPHADEHFAAQIHQRYRMPTHRLELLKPEIASRVGLRASRATHELVRRGRDTGKPLTYADLFCRQRLYFANIFLQHLDVAEAALPYYSWALLDYRVGHANRAFLPENYPLLFKRYFPKLAGIPHSSSLKPAGNSGGGKQPTASKGPPSRHVRRWSVELLRALADRTLLAGVQKRKLLPRLPSAFLAEPTYQDDVTFLHKLHWFEQRLRKCRLRFDWAAI